jgi:chaperonin GroEL (HSP60 family)
MQGNSQHPVVIMQNGTKQTNGSAAQRGNIGAAKAVADAIRTTLGPLGMDKMLIDPAGNILITNDGVSILREIGIEHPAAKMIVEVAKTQEDKCFDGTTSAVVLSGALLGQAERLLDKNIHPTTIIKGYRIARDHCVATMKEWVESKEIAIGTLEAKHKLSAATSLTGKSAEGIRDFLVNICDQAVQAVDDFEDITIISAAGRWETDTCLVKGVVVERPLTSPSMKKDILDAPILLLDTGIEPRDTKMDAQVQITSPDQVASFLQQEEDAIREMVDRIVKSKAEVVFTQKKVDELALHYLVKGGIVVVDNVQKSSLEALAKETGATIVSSLSQPIAKENIGRGDYLLNERFDNELVEIKARSSKYSSHATIIASGATRHVAEEIQRALEDAVGVCWLAWKEPVLPGGGATHAHLWHNLSVENMNRKHENGRISMAIEAFREALLSIPESIAENAGLDPVDARATLLHYHATGPGEPWHINIENTQVPEHAAQTGLVEPMSLHIQALTSATEAAIMILRIDDVISMNPEGAKPPM